MTRDEMELALDDAFAAVTGKRPETWGSTEIAQHIDRMRRLETAARDELVKQAKRPDPHQEDHTPAPSRFLEACLVALILLALVVTVWSVGVA